MTRRVALAPRDIRGALCGGLPLAGAISRYYLYRTFDDLDIPLSWNDVEKLAARFDPAGTGLINYAKVGEEVEKISGTLSSHCG